MHQRERTGGEIAWEELCCEGAALKMRSCWHGFYTELLLHRGALHRGALHEDLLHRESCIQGGLYTEKLLAVLTQRSLHTHTEAFTQRSYGKACTRRGFDTEKSLHRGAFTQRDFYTEQLLHTETFTHKGALHMEAFKHRSFYAQTGLHRSVCTRMRLHTEASTHRSFTQSCFYTEKSLHKVTKRSFTHRNFYRHRRVYTQEVLRTEAFTAH